MSFKSGVDKFLDGKITLVIILLTEPEIPKAINSFVPFTNV